MKLLSLLCLAMLMASYPGLSMGQEKPAPERREVKKAPKKDKAAAKPEAKKPEAKKPVAKKPAPAKK